MACPVTFATPSVRGTLVPTRGEREDVVEGAAVVIGRRHDTAETRGRGEALSGPGVGELDQAARVINVAQRRRVVAGLQRVEDTRPPRGGDRLLAETSAHERPGDRAVRV